MEKYTIINKGRRCTLGGFVFQGEADPSEGVNRLNDATLNAICRNLGLSPSESALQAIFDDTGDAPISKPEVKERWTEADLAGLSFDELKDLASEFDIKGRSKADLIASIAGKERK